MPKGTTSLTDKLIGKVADMALSQVGFGLVSGSDVINMIKGGIGGG